MTSKETKPGQLKKLEDAVKAVYLIADPHITKFMCAMMISQRLTSDPIWSIIVAPSGGGKCLGKGTSVMMYDGSIKPVEKIVAGQLVMGDDSTPRRVLNITKGKEKLFKIEQKRGDSYIVNESHILSLKQCSSKIEYKNFQRKSIIDISLKDYQKKSLNFKRIFKGYKVPVDFPEKAVTLDPYFLGVWLGDGRRNYPSITTMDIEIADFLYDFAARNQLKISTKKYPHTKAQAYLIVTKKPSRMIPNPISEKLKMYGLMPKKFIPQDYKINSREIRLQVLAGLIDTDGTLQIGDGKNRKKVNKSFNIISKDKQLAKDIIFISRSVGLHSSIRKRKIRIPNKKIFGIYWNVYIGGNIEIIPTKIKRKIAVSRARTTDSTLTSIKIKPLKSGEYFGFNLDGNGRFLLGDFTVTHNSEFINMLSKCKDVHPLSTLTSRTLVSGQHRAGVDTSLLHKIGKTGILTFKDFTSLLSENKDDRAAIMGQLREVWDGKYSKAFGTGETVNWEGKITVIAGATYNIHSLRRDYAAMGERFLFYNLIQPDGKEAARKTIHNQHEGNMFTKREELADMMHEYIDGTIIIPEKLPPLTAELEEEILDLAEMATRPRSETERNWRSPHQEITEVHPPEVPTRFSGALMVMAMALMIINQNETGEYTLLPGDKKILYKLALDSVTRSKSKAMQELAKYDMIETSGLATKINMPTNTVRRWLEDLTALEIAEREKGSGPKGDKWKIKPKYRVIMEKFAEIKFEGGELTGDNAEAKEELEAQRRLNEEF